MADIVGQDDIIAIDVERLAGAIEFVGELRLEELLAAAAGGLKCQRVDADVVRETTGFPIGGVPPIGHLTPLRIFIDPDLLQHDEVWAAAGTWHDVFPLAPSELTRVSGGQVVDLKRSPSS